MKIANSMIRLGQIHCKCLAVSYRMCHINAVLSATLTSFKITNNTFTFTCNCLLQNVIFLLWYFFFGGGAVLRSIWALGWKSKLLQS